MGKNIRKLHESFQHALRGLGLCIHGERNFRVHMVAAFYVTVFALIGRASAAEAAILCICFGLTMGAELMNTAIERIMADYDVPSQRLTIDEKKGIVDQLYARGIFALKGAVSTVAKRLDVSDQTVYRYLREVQSNRREQAV